MHSTPIDVVQSVESRGLYSLKASVVAMLSPGDCRSRMGCTVQLT